MNCASSPFFVPSILSIYSGFIKCSSSIKGFEHLVGMSLDIHFIKHLFDLALLVNQEGLARDAHKLLIAPGLLAVNAVGFRDRVVRVAKEREGEIVFRDESLVRLLIVERD